MSTPSPDQSEKRPLTESEKQALPVVWSVGDRAAWVDPLSNEATAFGPLVEIVADRHPVLGRKMVEIKSRDGAQSWVHASDLGRADVDSLTRAEQAGKPLPPPPAPAEPRKVYLDQVGLMAWEGLMSMRSDASRRLDAAREHEEKAHQARVMSLMTHLGGLDLLSQEYAGIVLRSENGKPYLEAVTEQPGEGQS